MAPTITRMTPPGLPDSTNVGYSQISIVEPGPLAFVSGQVAWRKDGSPVPASLEDQTKIVMENLSETLGSLGASAQDIVMMRAYMTDLRPETQAIVMGPLSLLLAGAQPSLTGIGVASLASPDLQLEVEMVVRVPD